MFPRAFSARIIHTLMQVLIYLSLTLFMNPLTMFETFDLDGITYASENAVFVSSRLTANVFVSIISLSGPEKSRCISALES